MVSFQPEELQSLGTRFDQIEAHLGLTGAASHKLALHLITEAIALKVKTDAFGVTGL